MKTITKTFEVMLSKPATPTWSATPTTGGPTQAWSWGGAPEMAWGWGG